LFQATENHKETDAKEEKLVSVAIPAYNEEPCIEKCLRSLARQETSARIEVILCLNACTDGTARTAIQVARRERLTLKLVDEPVKGIARARQRAFEHARGDIVFSADADSEYPPDWIERALATFRCSTRTALVYGPVYFTGLRGPGGWFFDHLYPVIDFVITQFDRIGGQPNVRGPNFAVDRKAFQRAGGFNVGLKAFEDNELAYRVARTCGRRSLRYNRGLVARSSARRYDAHGVLGGVFYYLNYHFQMFVLRREVPEFQDVRISS
jgi:glycosyltransferase involved in cell wall biosynthesis